MNINERLKELRIERGLSQKEVSDSIGLTLGAYAHYEQGVREPSIAIIKRLCAFFEVTSDYLIGLSDTY